MMRHLVYSTFLILSFFNTSEAIENSIKIDPFKRPPRFVQTDSGLRPDTPRPKDPAKLLALTEIPPSWLVPVKPN